MISYVFSSYPQISQPRIGEAEEEEDPEDVIAHVEDPEILVEETDDACDQGGFISKGFRLVAFGIYIADIADWKSHGFLKKP